jgi:hypothetical protein
MRSFLLIPILLAVSVPAFAARECSMVHKAMGWQRGKLVNAKVEERAERPSGGEANGAAAYGQLLRITVRSGETTYIARCAVGTQGCDPAALEGADDISFVILDKKAGKTLVFPRPDGHLTCALVATPAAAAPPQ